MFHLLLSALRGRRRTWRFYGVTCLSIKRGIISRWSGHPISSSMAHWETATWRRGSPSVRTRELASQKWTVWMHQIKSAWYKNKCSKEMQMCAHTRLARRRRIVVSWFCCNRHTWSKPTIFRCHRKCFRRLCWCCYWLTGEWACEWMACIYKHTGQDQLVNDVSCSSSHGRGATLSLYTELCFTWQNCFSKWIDAALCGRPSRDQFHRKPHDWFMSRWSKLSFYFQGEILDR